MWHDTIRFVRCAKDAFPFVGPVHEYGLATTAAPLLAEEEQPELGGAADDGEAPALPRTQPLEEMADLPYDDGSAGTVACLNVLQHVADPGAVAGEMIRLLAPGGVLLVCSCTAGRMHADAGVLWRPAPHAFQTLLAPLDATLIGWQGREGDPHSIYAVGCKAPVSAEFLAGTERFLKTFRQTLERERQAVPWIEKLRQWVAQLAGRATTGRARRDYYDSQFVMHAPVDGRFRHEALAACLQMDQIGSRFDLTQ